MYINIIIIHLVYIFIYPEIGEPRLHLPSFPVGGFTWFSCSIPTHGMMIPDWCSSFLDALKSLAVLIWDFPATFYILPWCRCTSKRIRQLAVEAAGHRAEASNRRNRRNQVCIYTYIIMCIYIHTYVQHENGFSQHEMGDKVHTQCVANDIFDTANNDDSTT